MRVSKRAILAILSLAILIPPLAAQSETVSHPPTVSDYGIEPTRSYPGTIVLELLAVAEEEGLLAIDEAYSKGYKAGLLAAAPDTERYRSLAASWREEAERRPDTWALLRSFGIGVGVGAIIVVIGAIAWSL